MQGIDLEEPHDRSGAHRSCSSCTNRHGGWTSSNIDESQVADSLTNKNEVTDKMLYNNSSTAEVSDSYKYYKPSFVNNIGCG